ncbi:MAG: PilT/PilU family type 4a pilus ATPase [Candidatus Pacebacteria bacterium]|nr:PilT/PilU family type 4a pilus ATPase [Candidatus Paceibacterota bacterium]
MNDIKKFLDALIANNGSDLHLSAGDSPLIRIAGELIPLTNFDAPSNNDILAILKEMLGEKMLQSFIDNQEKDFAYNYEDHRLRGNAFIQRGQYAVSLRLVPKARNLKELSLPSILEDFAMARQGFFLVVGPVGQGKTTTLTSMIEIINEKRSAHIITIEDPAEYVFKNKKSLIHQREVGIDTKDFDTALKSVFREDVNVILVGEMRSHETMSTAVTAAETGHLVLSTLHTNNAAQSIDRIIDSFPANQQDQIRSQLASTLLGIFSQRLIPKIGGGRVPAYELLINNSAVANLIREKRTHELNIVIETSLEQGMVDLNRSLIELIKTGQITLDNAILYSNNLKALQQML